MLIFVLESILANPIFKISILFENSFPGNNTWAGFKRWKVNVISALIAISSI